ncbi:hypothetical protein AVEN_6226-1 [Araneus ventricosus]|uniref:Uncharacterized protein n=1 Tax=Araneus ventricosus TaxID=182803 RepID=A0A4Y2GRL6_ARAVE|nr:hypothetical protein AVEN_6226-1 [Araneus ventricosus]
MQFYPPRQEIEYKTAIAKSNPKNHLVPSAPKSLCPPRLRRPVTPEGHRHPWVHCCSSLPSTGIKRNVTKLCLITTKLNDLDLLSTTVRIEFLFPHNSLAIEGREKI